MNLYHFTKAETAIRNILPSMKLRMNFLSNMNDPNENLYHVVNFEDNVLKKAKYSLSGYEFDMAQKIRNETRILAFSIDKEILTENIKLNVFGYQFQRMWATYGQNHKGICLVIDFEKFINENKKFINEYRIHKKQVIYRNFQYKEIPVQLYGMSPENQKKHKPKCLCEFWTDKQNDETFVENRFFTKNLDWKGESEYRFLSIKNSLSMVILGINFSECNLPSLVELVPKEKLFGIDTDLDGSFEIQNIY